MGGGSFFPAVRLALLTVLSFVFLAPSAFAGHPFDARRYAHEIFAEDEIALSKYAADIDEETVLRLLEKSWADLDRAADRAAGLPPDQARAALQAAVRGEGGISESYDRRLRDEAKTAAQPVTAAARIARAARHPMIWALAGGFLILMVWVNFRERQKPSQKSPPA